MIVKEDMPVAEDYLHDAHPYPRVKRVGSFGGYPSTEPGLKAATWDSHPCGVRNCPGWKAQIGFMGDNFGVLPYSIDRVHTP
jgi:hypothetical protein